MHLERSHRLLICELAHITASIHKSSFCASPFVVLLASLRPLTRNPGSNAGGEPAQPPAASWENKRKLCSGIRTQFWVERSVTTGEQQNMGTLITLPCAFEITQEGLSGCHLSFLLNFAAN
ncbi:hypothetical protein FQA47_024904 [Oryzias melastigma]|uniref:Uncharacterized protein n=1 Tax=Oryzias melastigma TaxID=30732 RepID=A0A834FNZ4_ORYME|nr:hypothetical protein FQA47_024904 [Oryzias melastigma]